MGWMGPVVDDQEHEGWVVPLFADGAQGAGTSSARGLLVARRPDEGPCNGDRVRLTYRDGSTAEGVWQDSTLLRGDGIAHAHTSGQVLLEVTEQAEEWRPDAAVVGWAAGCTCGWRGTPWTRVPPELADPAARRLAVTGPWADLEAADENRVMQDWRRHIAGWQAPRGRRGGRRPAGRRRPLAGRGGAHRTRGRSRVGRHRPGRRHDRPGRPPSGGPPMTEQPTGHPGPTAGTQPGQRAMLVVDLDGEPLAPLRALEEILLCLGMWEDDDRRNPSAGTEPLRLPPPLADRVALAAVQRLLTALAPTQ